MTHETEKGLEPCPLNDNVDCAKCDDTGYIETIGGGIWTGEGVTTTRRLCDCPCGDDARDQENGTGLHATRTTPLPDGGDVEAVARAIALDTFQNDELAEPWWGDQALQPANTIRLSPAQKDQYRSRARAAIAAMPNRATAGEAVAWRAPVHADDCDAMQRPRADCTCVPATPPAPKDGEVERLREALSKVRDQFQFYTDEHKTKADTAEKAWDDACYWSNVAEQEQTRAEFRKRHQQMETNAAFVRMIDATLNERKG